MKKLCDIEKDYLTFVTYFSDLFAILLLLLPGNLFSLSFSKEALHLRWNERHLRTYFETLMALS